MRSHVEVFGHSLHQMLIVFPLGLLATSVVFDLLALGMHEGSLSVAAYWMLTAGIVGALLAAPFGFIDWLHIPEGTRAKRVGAMHGGGNVLVLLLFAGSWFLRTRGMPAPAIALVLSLLGAGIAVVTGWLGGELVDRLGIGVHDGANVNAPSSLRTLHH
jgi:uncharacterized membrane protein